MAYGSEYLGYSGQAPQSDPIGTAVGQMQGLAKAQKSLQNLKQLQSRMAFPSSGSTEAPSSDGE